MPQRVFFALWPDEATRDALVTLRAAHPGNGRDVPRAHLHLTLAFAGSVDSRQVAAIQSGADALHAPAAFDLWLDRLDGFAQARVQWLGPSDPPTALTTLAQRLQAVCRSAGIALSGEAFRPHVTLRRHVEEPQQARVPGLHWPVRDFALIESGRDGRPGTYRKLCSWPLPA